MKLNLRLLNYQTEEFLDLPYSVATTLNLAEKVFVM